MKKVYFLCTGNSCRSQMAEGFARQYLADQWQIASAGIEKHGLNPMAVTVMAESGVDIRQQFSKLIDTEYLMQCDLVVTLCGDARDRCPTLPSTIASQHWNLPDPAKSSGCESEQLACFRSVRDQIEALVKGLAFF